MTARWRDELAVALGPGNPIRRVESVAGGNINEAWRIECAAGPVFVKTHASPPPGLYAAEAAGLGWLAEGPLRLPRVIAAADSFLALEWLELSPRSRERGFDERFGRALAGLHALGAPRLGAERDNYLATLRQDNAACDDVPTWWVERRLRPLIARLATGTPDRSLVARLEAGLARLVAQPERFGPPEEHARPARLHGDLWWGNVGAVGGEPVVFDPAAYGGPREIDLAMLALFGGLGDRLIAAYDEVWPLADGWRERIGLWQLYPIAVHAVLFGGSYTGQLVRGLDELT